jgi:hypothetical protein
LIISHPAEANDTASPETRLFAGNKPISALNCLEILDFERFTARLPANAGLTLGRLFSNF